MLLAYVNILIYIIHKIISLLFRFICYKSFFQQVRCLGVGSCAYLRAQVGAGTCTFLVFLKNRDFTGTSIIALDIGDLTSFKSFNAQGPPNFLIFF